MSDDCSMQYYFACETTPLSLPPDYPCPKGFYPYKDKCLAPSQAQMDFDTATVSYTISLAYRFVIISWYPHQ